MQMNLRLSDKAKFLIDKGYDKSTVQGTLKRALQG